MVIYQIFETIDIKGYKALRGNDLLSVSPWAFRTMHSCEISLAATWVNGTTHLHKHVTVDISSIHCQLFHLAQLWPALPSECIFGSFQSVHTSFLQHLVGKLPLRKAAERLSWAFYCDSFNKVDSSLDGWWFYSNKQERNQTFHSNQSVMHEWWE